jgi:hypothetical protein
MKKLIMLALACAALAYAAEDTRVQKIVPITTGDTTQIFMTVANVMASMPIKIQMYQNTLVLNGTQESVTSAEQLIKNLMSAAPRERNIEITGYIILASVDWKSEQGHNLPAGGGVANMPADLDPVLKQFRSLLNYKAFHVLDTIILRGRENSIMTSSGFLAVPGVPGSTGATVEFRVQRPSVTEDVVHLKDLNLNVRIPTTNVNDKGAVYSNEVRISTDADVKAGQKVAIGKASVDANGDALILVVSAKVVD